MSIANSIIEAMSHREEDEVILMRNKLRTSKVLNKSDFKQLVQILQTKSIEMLSFPDLTMNEYHLIGKGLMAAKIQDTQETIDFIIEQDNKRTATLLHCLLNKGCKFDTGKLQEFVKKMLKSEIHLIQLKILHVISKNYPQLINQSVFDFCETNEHPICKEILKNHKLEIE